MYTKKAKKAFLSFFSANKLHCLILKSAVQESNQKQEYILYASIFMTLKKRVVCIGGLAGEGHQEVFWVMKVSYIPIWVGVTEKLGTVYLTGSCTGYSHMVSK